jgi:hypothetical protein
MVVPTAVPHHPHSLQPQPAMNRSKSHRERLASDLQSAHRDRANALIERRIMLAELEALHLRIAEIEEYLKSLTRALDGPTYSAKPATPVNRR